MNNGLFPNSSNGAVRYDPVKGNLVIGDGDQGRSSVGQNLISLGQGNNLSGIQEANLILGSGNTVNGGAASFGTNSRNTILGSGNILYANTLGTTDGNNIMIGNNNVTGSVLSSFKYSHIVIGSANITSGTNAVAIGTNTRTSGSDPISIGNSSNAASSSSIAIGKNASAANNQCVAIGEGSNTGSAYGSTAFGNAVSRTNGSYAFGPYALIGTVGNQASIIQLNVVTSDGTTTEATAWITGLHRVVLQNNQFMAFRGTATARCTTDITKCKMFTFDGAIRRGAGIATTALVGNVSYTSIGDTGTEAWTIDASANTTFGNLQINVTGAAATSIKWHIRIDTVENM